MVLFIVQSSGSQTGATWLTKEVLILGRKFVPGRIWGGKTADEKP